MGYEWSALLEAIGSRTLPFKYNPPEMMEDRLKRSTVKAAWYLALLDFFFGLSHLDDSASSQLDDDEATLIAMNSFANNVPFSWTLGVVMQNYRSDLQ